MSASSIALRLARIVGEACFPTRCYGCGRLYRQSLQNSVGFADSLNEADLRDLVADVLCPQCARVEWIDSPMCPDCGRPFASPQGIDHPCGDCRRKSFSFDGARAAGVYDHGLRLLISLFKYQGLVQLADPLGRFMWDTMSRFNRISDFDRFIPVPLHWRRRRRRGFNQAELLMRHWPRRARDSGLSWDPRKMAAGDLIRCRPTPSQTGLGGKARKRNLRHAFRVKSAGAVRGCRVLLVDDVLTTGATADACARALKRSGAASVHVLTLARAV